MEYMRSLPDKAFDVVVADPPYNIAKAAWDKWPSVDAYVRDVMAWLREFSRILKDTGSLWMFHSDMSQLCRIMAESQTLPGLVLRDFIVLYKRNFRTQNWKTAECAKNTDCEASSMSTSTLSTGSQLPAATLLGIEPGLIILTATLNVISR